MDVDDWKQQAPDVAPLPSLSFFHRTTDLPPSSSSSSSSSSSTSVSFPSSPPARSNNPR